ncbi:MAG: hypothetical protein ACSLEN_04480 [Candidatus Malihini olakiniferum]
MQRVLQPSSPGRYSRAQRRGAANQHLKNSTDLFTIQETQGRLNNINIAMVGDLKYGRTMHSLTQALAKFASNRFYFIALDALAMPDYILAMLKEKNITYSLHTSIEEVISEMDILYMTRVQVQKERLDLSEYITQYQVTVCATRGRSGAAHDNLKVLHPLQRVDEITTDVDNTPYAYYYQQAGNGLFARQALVLNRELVL